MPPEETNSGATGTAAGGVRRTPISKWNAWCLFGVVFLGAFALVVLGVFAVGVTWFIKWSVNDATWPSGLALLLGMLAGLGLFSWSLLQGQERWAATGFVLFASPMLVGYLPFFGDSSAWPIGVAAATCIASAIVAHVVRSSVCDLRAERSADPSTESGQQDLPN